MSARIDSITLPVTNLERSLRFYKNGLDLPIDESSESAVSEDHVAIELDGGPYLVLILRPEFEQFTELTGRPAAPQDTSGCILSYFASSREEVDLLLQQCAEYGGTVSAESAERLWGYAGYVQDPDGHPWEIMFNPTLVSE